jgi:hypothetical protein
MGLLSKIWKSIKKPFKAIGKAVKGAFKSFGKIMNKAGILGQVAMFFILPGIANAALGALGGAFTGAAASLAGSTATGVMGSIARGAGWVMQKAGQFASVAKAGFKTVTGAVTEFFGATGKYIGGKLGIGQLPNISAKQAWGQYSDAMVKNFDVFKTAGADLLGQGAVSSAMPLPAATPTEQFRMNQESVLGETPDFTKSILPEPMSYPAGASFPAAVAPPPSLLGRVAALPGQALDYAKALPGRAADYVVSGDMGRDALAKAEAIPGSIATSMVTNTLMEAVNPAEEYVEKPAWYSNTGTYRSSPAVQASQVAADDYLAFMNQYSINTSPDGLWGGATNTKTYYDNVMQQFA